MNLNEIWKTCLDNLFSSNIIKDEFYYSTLCEETSLKSIKDKEALILCNMQWYVNTLNDIKDDVQAVLSSLTKQDLTVNIINKDAYSSLPPIKKEPKLISKLNAEMTFDNFVVGSSNKMAQNASLMVATNPGNHFNPLFIYSNPGLGKTHLLNAIGNHIKETKPDLVPYYVSSKDFVDEIINAMKTNKTDDIYEHYKNIDVLLIDDIQFLFGKEKSSEMFFHIFNELLNNNKQIVITSDKRPQELQGIEDRLISRFNSGLSFGIDPPEFETAKAILYKKIENLGNSSLEITEDVIDFMAINYCKDIRSLEGQLKSVYFNSIILGVDTIDMEIASEIFKDTFISNSKVPVTKEHILKKVADFYYLSVNQITSKNRSQKLVTPREICMYLMRELIDDITFSEIGAAFSNRDHSTVMKACKRVENKIKKDNDYKLAIEKIKQKIGTN